MQKCAIFFSLSLFIHYIWEIVRNFINCKLEKYAWYCFQFRWCPFSCQDFYLNIRRCAFEFHPYRNNSVFTQCTQWLARLIFGGGANSIGKNKRSYGINIQSLCASNQSNALHEYTLNALEICRIKCGNYRIKFKINKNWLSKWIESIEFWIEWSWKSGFCGK